MGDALPVVDLGPGRTAKAITAGAFHTCALLDNEELKCWGYNGHGAIGFGRNENLGDAAGEMGEALPAVNLGLGRKALSVVASHVGTCAILDMGLLKCWGGNEAGVLGLGDTQSRGDGSGEMGDQLPTVFLGLGRTVKSVVSNLHTCAILSTDELKCWGRNDTGQLGLGDTNARGDQRSEATLGYDPIDLAIDG